MGVRVLSNKDDNMACLYDSVTDWAFGPVIYSHDNTAPASERIASFANWLPADARTYSQNDLETKFAEYLALEGKE